MAQTTGIAAPAPARGGTRMLFIDNLRWVMILLVISMHAAVTYSSLGRWYYREPSSPALPERVVFAAYQSFLQAFFMGLLFFVAGYFVPGSFDKKGAGRFLAYRAVRLGTPTLLYVFLIGPLTEYYVAHSWGGSGSFAEQWLGHVRSGEFVGMTGPLWFCVALLLFCCAYAVRAVPSLHMTMPGNRAVVLFIALISVCTFTVRIWQPMGSAVANMQLANFSQYVLMFSAGVWAYRNDWLARLPYSFGVRWMAASLAAGIPMWLLTIYFSGALQGQLEPLDGGWHWQSAALCVWESLVCVGVSLGLIVLFREKFYKQGSIARFLSANAFAAYVLHPPVLIGLALLLHPVAAPALVKFLALTALASLATLAMSAVLRRIPLLGRVLA